MNFSKQLKMYREREGYSQEELAQKIYVTRQSISKWENDHTYPDIHNLIALSTLFDVTLDELVKGDVEKMKKSIDREKMDKLTWRMLIFMILTAVSIVPFVEKWGWYGFGISMGFWAIAMIAALKIEKMKKDKDIKTYAEIVAFVEGNDIEAVRKKRDFLNKVIIVLVFSFVFSVITIISKFVWLLLS
ncbi:helix-turn-helix domain-containing protein [Isobaculum melis]|uniref:DNA-binding transcriptional regulator, XRE-family HTH domain n=1 Tax=Isobaculum melis TaxID=142588 RepID=A0A1H9PRY5_9LACT|nr:helix-turn-helix transcriptional regulator [Isobaculum melis]SER50870.1 DNA-binding transcriptional regulator, XRE-family HTH domain [Isobaculum melis]